MTASRTARFLFGTERKIRLAVAAMDELRQAIAINPRNAPAQHLLGKLLDRLGDTVVALARYDRMAARFRSDLVVLVNSGVLSAQKGDTAKSLGRFAAALRLAPHDSQLHRNLAETHAAMGDAARAIQQYELYTELHRDDCEHSEVLPIYLRVGLKLGELYETQSQRTRAVAWYRRVLTWRKLATACPTHLPRRRNCARSMPGLKTAPRILAQTPEGFSRDQTAKPTVLRDNYSAKADVSRRRSRRRSNLGRPRAGRRRPWA